MAAHPTTDAALADLIEETLADFVRRQRERLAALGPDASELLDAAGVALRGGKRLRARFCYWGYLAARPTPGDEEVAALLRACAGLEVLHASALVHDDLMDASDTRRGHPSTHRAFARTHQHRDWPGDPEQYGAAAAILLGDLLLTWADELIRRCGLPSEQVGRALDYFDLCRSEVVTGQFLDVSVQARGHATREEALRVLHYKSAAYSVERPLHIGAALAGAGDDLIDALSAFGAPLGAAFQLRDDQLGVFGEPATTGKPAGDDLVEGKRTVLIARALESLDPAGAADLDAALGSPMDPTQVQHLRGLIETSGARQAVEDDIADLTRSAESALSRAALPPEPHAALAALIGAATRREV